MQTTGDGKMLRTVGLDPVAHGPARGLFFRALQIKNNNQKSKFREAESGDHEPAACPGCPESQWDPGVHQEECGQQVEGGSPPPLLCPGEAPSAVLGPVLGSPVQER